MSDPDLAQLISGALLAGVTVTLAFVGREDAVVNKDLTYQMPDGSERSVTRGTAIPKSHAKNLPTEEIKHQRRSWLGAMLVGKDHRTSTSKTIVFAWSLAVAFGLLSLLIAVWLGDHEPWDKQVDRGMQEEYLLLLGGPFAAAILAKYAAVSQSETKTDAAIGSAKPSQLVNDDSGDTDLGDFQYVLFTILALAFFLGDFIGDLSGAFPELPAILTGLVLTSTGGYAAKKLIAQAAPTLNSVLPAASSPDSEVQVFGTNLAIPANVSNTGESMKPTVFIGSERAEVSAHDLVLGNDRLTVKIPSNLKPGPAPISAARADGVAARGRSGMNVLPFEIK